MELTLDWQQLLLWASAMSLLMAVATLIAIPWVVTRLPSDYFSRPMRVIWRLSPDAPVLALVVGTLKNLLGLVLVILGLIMLVTPGQGLLTLLVGLLLMNFPGKYQLERWLVMRPGLLRGMNWLRRRAGKAEFETPQTGPTAE